MTTTYQNHLKAVLEYIEAAPDLILPQQLKSQKEGKLIALKEAINMAKQVQKRGGLKTVLAGFDATQQTLFSEESTNLTNT